VYTCVHDIMYNTSTYPILSPFFAIGTMLIVFKLQLDSWTTAQKCHLGNQTNNNLHIQCSEGHACIDQSSCVSCLAPAPCLQSMYDILLSLFWIYTEEFADQPLWDLRQQCSYPVVIPPPSFPIDKAVHINFILNFPTSLLLPKVVPSTPGANWVQKYLSIHRPYSYSLPPPSNPFLPLTILYAS
jgi:hypothetical protein